MIPTSIDGTDITGATIDGTDVQEITVDGNVVFSAGPTNVFEDFESGNVNDWTDRFGTITITSNPINGNFSGLVGPAGGQGLTSATYDPSFITSSVNTMEVAAEFIEDTDVDFCGVALCDNSNPGTSVSCTWNSGVGGEAIIYETINTNDTRLFAPASGSRFGSTIRIELLYNFNTNTITGTWFENGSQFEQATVSTSVSTLNVAGVATIRNNPKVDDFEVNFT